MVKCGDTRAFENTLMPTWNVQPIHSTFTVNSEIVLQTLVLDVPFICFRGFPAYFDY